MSYHLVAKHFVSEGFAVKQSKTMVIELLQILVDFKLKLIHQLITEHQSTSQLKS